MKFSAFQIAYIAVCAATVTAGKLALAAIPNVEIVSLLLAAYGYVFGGAGVLAAFVFCGVEVLIWGAGSWVALYFVMTVLFGVLSSLIDTGLFTGFHENFWQRFAIIYARGASFYITQTVCNAITFTLLFIPFTALLRKITPAKLLHIDKQKTLDRGEKTSENTFNCHII